MLVDMPQQAAATSPVPKSEPSDTAQLDNLSDEPRRGRKKEREDDDAEEDENGVPRNGERRRKRSRKTLDKKYLCPQEGCGKSYSRAEHLYRHQLNHTPKQIYHCDFPDCARQFVRQDLCVRHRERHTTKGSTLQRKDNYITQALVDQAPKPLAQTKRSETGNNASSNQFHHTPYDSLPAVMQSPTESMGPPRNDSMNDAYQASNFHSPNTPYKSSLHRSNSDSQYAGDGNANVQASRNMSMSYNTQQRPGSFGSIDAAIFRPNTTINHADNNSSDNMQWNGQSRMNIPLQGPNAGYNGFTQPYPVVSGMNQMYPPAQNGEYHSQPYYNSSQDYLTRNLSTESMGTTLQAESPMHDVGWPMMEEDVYGRSPSMIPEVFERWLLDQNHQSMQHVQRGMNDFVLDPSLQMSISGLPTIPTQTSMSVNGLLEPSSRSAVISEKKRKQLIELFSNFDADNSPVAKERENVMSGDFNSERHALSKHNMQQYIESYWTCFHDQMPILHRPTFSADKCQNLLLIAVLAIGAANLDKGHGQTVVAAAADLAQFLAWHLRGKLFEDRDFPPPTKLWVLQTLILLECYEKLYSTRSLHERSAIHHATTISLLRRGSALLGRSAVDSPPGEEDKHFVADTTDPWWNHWITDESTKRVAYALFIIDSTHAIMFGHTAVMLAHEMRLTLPCDEELWKANSGMEVGRLEASLRGTGVQKITFPDGLKSTLSGKKVRTNRFGRTALMAGLLNVTFHLGQRDVQVRSLGVIGAKEPVWRSSLTAAFDIWDKDWENDHEPQTTSTLANRHIRDSSHTSAPSTTSEEEHIFESRVVLHHLAHMGMHVDVVQCQIYAKARRLLGRTITPNDYNTCAKRMKEWAGKASARDAVYYSLKFLEAVLAPDISKGTSVQQKPPPFRANIGEYAPRDDYLLNRPWVVYFAALVVWSYGYALDGPLKPSAIPSLETKAEQVADMRQFLLRVGSVAEPGDLVELAGKRNTCTGLLCFLSSQFKKSRWELLHEAGTLLNNCVDMLRGTTSGQGIA